MQIDTGAQVSCLPLHFLKKEDREKLIPSNIGLESFNGGSIKTFGCISTNLQIGEINFKNCLFYIVENNSSILYMTNHLLKEGFC